MENDYHCGYSCTNNQPKDDITLPTVSQIIKQNNKKEQIARSERPSLKNNRITPNQRWYDLNYEDKIKVDLYNTPSRKTSKKKSVTIKESTIRETKADEITLPKDTSEYAFDDELIIDGIDQDPFKLETLKENVIELLNSKGTEQKEDKGNMNEEQVKKVVKEHHSFKVKPSIRQSKKTPDGNKKYKSQKAIRRSSKIKIQKIKEKMRK